MNNAPQDDVPEPANLRILRGLVTVLTVTMIAGIIVIIALLVIRLNQTSTPLPEALTLPDGTVATAFTQARNWYAVVTQDDTILIFARDTGRLLRTIVIEAE